MSLFWVILLHRVGSLGHGLKNIHNIRLWAQGLRPYIAPDLIERAKKNRFYLI